MMMKRRTRGKHGAVACCDFCDVNMTDIKRYRRRIRRVEKQIWKRDI
jgi:hypothetical protein